MREVRDGLGGAAYALMTRRGLHEPLLHFAVLGGVWVTLDRVRPPPVDASNIMRVDDRVKSSLAKKGEQATP